MMGQKKGLRLNRKLIHYAVTKTKYNLQIYHTFHKILIHLILQANYY